MTSAQDDSESTAGIIIKSSLTVDSTFVELHLSPEGVYGVDRNGDEWEYDFSSETFVNEKPGLDRPTTITIFSRDRRLSTEDFDDSDIRDELDEIDLADIEALAEDAALAEANAEIRKFKGLQLHSVDVEDGEVVDGSIVAVGAVTVKGTVHGDVVSYKRVTITSTGVIDGDARAPEIVKMRGGTIVGDRHETDLPPLPYITIFERTSYTALWVIMIIFAALLFVSLIGAGVVPRHIERVSQCLEKQFAKSFLIGFAGWLALGPLMAILVLTIIGIPVAILVLPVALIIGVILGIIAVSQRTGRLVAKYIGWKSDLQLKQILSGLTILYSAWIFMSLLMVSTAGAVEGFAVFFMVIAIIIWSIAVSAGIGAVVLTRFGTRDPKKISISRVTVRVETPPPPTPPPLNPNDRQ